MSNNSDLIEEVSKEKFERDEINQILIILKQSKDLKDFNKKSVNRLKIIEERNPELRFKIDLIISGWMYTYKPVWYKKYKQYENLNLDTKNPLVHMSKVYDILKLERENSGEYPENWIPDELPKDVLKSTIKELRQEIRKLKEDRILLYEEFIKEINASSLKDEEKEAIQVKYEKYINNLKSKIITPKGYDIESLVKYYIECSISRKLGNPSFRDLEKGSEYKKDKWSIILKDDIFIFSLWSELHKLKMSGKFKSKDWFHKLYDLWTKEFMKLQKKNENQSSNSSAREYNDNMDFNE